MVLFNILFHAKPFDCDKRESYERHILENNDVLRLPQTNGVSAAATDLLRSMLEKDPEQRITVGQVLAHAWLQ